MAQATAARASWGVRPREWGALIAAIVGLIGAATIIVVDPDRTGGSSDVTALDMSAPALPGEVQEADGPLVAAEPPAVGTYRRRVTTVVEGEDLGGRTKREVETDYTVRRLADAPADGATHIAYEVDGRTQATLAWHPDGAKAVSMQVFEEECVFEEPMVAYQLPLSVGSKWESTGNCVVDVRGATLTVEATVRATVTGTKQVEVGGTDVDVYVIERESETLQTGEMRGNDVSAQMRQQEVELFAPALGLPVLTNTVTVTSFGADDQLRQGAKTTAEVRLLGTKPEEAR